MATAQRTLRLAQELKMLERDPPPGVCVFPAEGRSDQLRAQLVGPADSPYEQGLFRLSITIPERYPFQPPVVGFLTPIYHPNIDAGGRICLDTLKMPPQGSWRPSINLATVLSTIQLLMGTPNPDDGLMPEISQLLRRDPEAFRETARAHCLQHARIPGSFPAGDSATSASGPSTPPPPPLPEMALDAAPSGRPTNDAAYKAGEAGSGAAPELSRPHRKRKMSAPRPLVTVLDSLPASPPPSPPSSPPIAAPEAPLAEPAAKRLRMGEEALRPEAEAHEANILSDSD